MVLRTALYGSPKCTVARLDFDRKQLKVVQGKAKRPMFHFRTLDSTQKIHRSRKPQDYLLTTTIAYWSR
jgi:hypothetical protein